MDSESSILRTLREVVGCNGLRDFGDLGKLRQDTLERRLNAVGGKILSRGSVLSIYAMWLRDQISRVGGAERTKMVRQFCEFLNDWHCDLDRVQEVWADCTRTPVKNSTMDQQDRLSRQMEEVCREITQEFPTRKSSQTQMPAPVPHKPKERGTSQEYQPRQSWSRSKESTSRVSCPPSRTRTKYSGTSMPNLDLTRDHWTRTTDLKSGLKFEKGQTHEKQGSSIPSNYVCRRCRNEGHLIHDCPTNDNPAWDFLPRLDYKCRICGAQGDHYISACPRAKTVAEPEAGRKSRLEAPPEKELLWSNCSDRDAQKGRLSPWESTTFASPIGEDEGSSDCEKVKEKVKANLNAENFLSQIEQQLCVEASGFKSDYRTVGPPATDETDSHYTQTQGQINKRQKLEVGDIHPGGTAGYSEHSRGYSLFDERLECSVESGAAQKLLLRNPPYSRKVINLLMFKGNPRIKYSTRPTALDMWDTRE